MHTNIQYDQKPSNVVKNHGVLGGSEVSFASKIDSEVNPEVRLKSTISNESLLEVLKQGARK